MAMTIKDNTYYTITDIHEGLGYSVYMLQKWASAGVLKATKAHKKYIVKSEDLRSFLETRS